MIRVENLKKWFPLSTGVVASLLEKREKRYLKAVDGISFAVEKGEILGMAGESGCGKTTVGMTIIKLYEPSSGHIFFNGQDVTNLSGSELKRFRR
ncbi:MAG: ABC transporter ATP-binding protein, partial [bacterium]|nr:ABC transporter ATP-binding protein [bacterium]